MNEQRTGKCLRQTEHIRGNLCHIYSIAVKHVMMATYNHKNYKKVFSLNYLLNKSCAVTLVWTDSTYTPQSYSSMILY
jgi:hypothetical protein